MSASGIALMHHDGVQLIDIFPFLLVLLDELSVERLTHSHGATVLSANFPESLDSLISAVCKGRMACGRDRRGLIFIVL